MSRKHYKSQASSSRALSGAFTAPDGFPGGGIFGLVRDFNSVSPDFLSCIYEPPDLSAISEPNVVVAFKNLQKKDSTTKAKALEDLQSYSASPAVEENGLEDPIVETWIKLYPRTSIDSARRVRQLAHALQGQVATSCGKRIAKHLPNAIGAWLTGLHDNDKVVARTAQDAFCRVFPSDEKQLAVWKLFQPYILAYCENCIFIENPTTLSDERTTSLDDATMKYGRVIGCAILTVMTALNTLPTADVQKQEEKYRRILAADRIWKSVLQADAFVRKAVFKLLATVLIRRKKDWIHPEMISTHLLQNLLNVNQIGSAYEYVKMLAYLTTNLPEIWTTFYSTATKNSATKRICQFLRKGSQGAPAEFWDQIWVIFQHIPSVISCAITVSNESDDVAKSSNDSFPVLKSLLEGITRPDEHRANQDKAWQTYFQAAERLLSLLPSKELHRKLAHDSLIPIIEQYVRPSGEGRQWVLSGVGQQGCRKVIELIMHTSFSEFEETWYKLSADVLQDLRQSLPEQSKDFTKSQDLLVKQVKRWYSLQAGILTGPESAIFHPLSLVTATNELRTAIDILRTRNGKPYSAAAALEAAVRTLPHDTFSNSSTERLLFEFARTDVPELLLSHSSPYLIEFLIVLGNDQEAEDIRRKNLNALIIAPDSAMKYKALRYLVSSPWMARTALAAELEKLMKNVLQEALEGNNDSWLLVEASIGNAHISNEVMDSVLANMTNSLFVDGQTAAGLSSIGKLMKRNEPAIKAFTNSTSGGRLFSRLLFLSELPLEEIALQAQGLTSTIRTSTAREKLSKTTNEFMVQIIQMGITTADSHSLSVTSLVAQAEQVLTEATEDELSAMSAALLPNESEWIKTMEPFFEQIPPIALAITNSLGGCIHFIKPTSKLNHEASVNIPRDLEGYSSLLRMACYVTRLIRSTTIMDIMSTAQSSTVCRYLALFAQLASDNLHIPQSNGLLNSEDVEANNDLTDIIAEVQALLISWAQGLTLPQASISTDVFVNESRAELLQKARGDTTSSYYSSRAYVALSLALKQSRGLVIVTGEIYNHSLDLVHGISDPIFEAAFLETLPDESMRAVCNRLIAELTGPGFSSKSRQVLSQSVFLNKVLESHNDVLLSATPQRLVFLIKHIISQIRYGGLPLDLTSELLKILAAMLPFIRDLYGSLWADVIDILINTWIDFDENEGEQVLILHASLRLSEQLESLTCRDVNDDLLDSWLGKKMLIYNGLLRLMQCQSTLPDNFHQPRRMANSLLAKQLKSLSNESTIDSLSLYPIIACESTVLQQAAFDILHRQIPEAQEQMSLDAALSKDYNARLPEELISLLITVPEPDLLISSTHNIVTPPHLHSYLLSWRLIFDHWINSSYKVQIDYGTAIRDGPFLRNFLDFAANGLIASKPRPVDPSRFNIESYNDQVEQSPEMATQRLLAYLYYECLKRFPMLSKAWWRDDCSRQMQKLIESWTEKYISPLVIQSELSAVTDWISTQNSTDEPLTVKVFLRSHELIASYPVDDKVMSIRIILPSTYPLSPVTVESVHRVGVDERKWRSWLITTQGIINFSSGSGTLIDGLVAWRRNLEGALKGQSECAICYSVVSSDKQLPSKRCSTCKNLFHGSCLFRWFKSSGSSSCPLCRNAFNYG